MYCPICGHQLTLQPKTPPPSINYDLEGDAFMESMKAHDDAVNCKRDEYMCTNPKCIYRNTPFYHHQAWQGFESEPGDSWSLTYLK